MSLTAGKRWYAVQTRSNFESSVCTELASRKIESYHASFPEIHEWADRRKVVHRPLFPGYVFARFSGSSEERVLVLQAPGVVRILGSDRAIEPIPDVEIDSIRRMLRSGRPWQSHPFLREGARARVRRGPLRNVEGILVRVKSDARLVMSITLFSKSVATEVNIADLELLSECVKSFPNTGGRVCIPI